MTFDSNSCVSRGNARFVPEGVRGDSGSDLAALFVLSRKLSVLLCSSIRRNFSINMSRALLACNMFRSRRDRRGSSDRSIAFTAVYKVDSVSGTGALKYSSNASSSSGCLSLVFWSDLEIVLDKLCKCV